MKITNPKYLRDKMNELERSSGEILLESSDEGIIGSRNLKSGNWVRRTPADIYWNGIRTYGIFTGGNMSQAEYFIVSCNLKSKNKIVKALGNRHDEAEENERDDADAGGLFHTTFWKLPEYQSAQDVGDGWQKDLHIELTPIEAAFLKKQIIVNCPNTLLSFILANERKDFIQFQNFSEMGEALLPSLTARMQDDIILAKAFSDFIYGARIRYNVILSEGKNEEAGEEWEAYMPDLLAKANLDLDRIYNRLTIGNPSLRQFLNGLRSDMLNTDIAAMDNKIIRREIDLKTRSRAKLLKTGEFPIDTWFGGRRLDYQFGNAKRIVEDIFNGGCQIKALFLLHKAE
jgi:hypothetical protein